MKFTVLFDYRFQTKPALIFLDIGDFKSEALQRDQSELDHYDFLSIQLIVWKGAIVDITSLLSTINLFHRLLSLGYPSWAFLTSYASVT